MGRKLRIALALWLIVPAACNGWLAPKASYLDANPAFAGDGLVHVVVEIPAGTNDKWEVEKASGTLHWEHQDGKPRVVQYLA